MKYNNLNGLKEEFEKKEMSKEQVETMKAAIERAKIEQRRQQKNMIYQRCLATAAALLMAFIILPNTSGSVAYAMSKIPVLGKLVEVVTWRDYQYEDEYNIADVDVSELVLVEEENSTENMISKGVAGEAITEQEAMEVKKENLQKSMDEINAEIQKITDAFIVEFEENLKNEQGYQDIIVESEIINTTEEYFTLKLFCYSGSASGTEWIYYYTIDLNSGERLQLKDIFVDGADYVALISENIKEQMEEQMAADEMIYYWLHDEMEEFNFKQIDPNQSFYLNENGEVVISFQEGDVAPMYMGAVEFVISNEFLEGIRK